MNKPLLAEAREKGRQGFLDGAKAGDAPYDEGDERWWEWMAGWGGEAMKRLRRNFPLETQESPMEEQT